MPLIRLLITLLVLFTITDCFAQTGDGYAGNKTIPVVFPLPDNDVLQLSGCIYTPMGGLFNAGVEKQKSGQYTTPAFITIHGNIYYDYLVRSRVDTPFAQQNFQQHTERVTLDIVLKDKYPLKVSFGATQSNSPYFRNFFDFNFRFDKYSYLAMLKKKLLNSLNAKIDSLYNLQRLQQQLQEKLKQYAKTKNWIESPATLQKLIEEKERKADPRLGTRHNILQDSTAKDFTAMYADKKAELDTLYKSYHATQSKIDTLRSTALDKLNTAQQNINQATSVNELNTLALKYGLQHNTSRIDRFLGGVKTFAIGKSVLDYTELTAQNILITGINAEYTSAHYFAFAAGKIDYHFRDFFNRATSKNEQYIILGRIGFGNMDKRAVIFTVYNGKKSQEDYLISNTTNNYVGLMGYAVQGIIKKNENTQLSVEFAKSTKPQAGNLQNSKQLAALWKLEDKTNMGINIKAAAFVNKTNTRLSGFFRKTGESFQSFSLFSYNTDQTAWQLRADQELARNRISATAMLRRNDFVNPFADKTYKTSTVFKSLVVNIHYPKYPSLSIGYYPGTQLYIVDKEKIRENAYYILNTSLAYNYRHKGTGMNTTVIYNHYFNQATDSGFVLYKGLNIYAAQTIFLKRFLLQVGYAYTRQPQLQYTTLESSLDYSLRTRIKLGAGVKYNVLKDGTAYWGGRARLSIQSKAWGTFQFQYEKTYLPAISQSLYPVEIGRASWYKIF